MKAFLFRLTSTVSAILGISTKKVIPPTETGSIVANKSHVVVVMVISTSPEGDKVASRPREVVARVTINGLEETAGDPEEHGKHMKLPITRAMKVVSFNEMVDEGTTNGTKTENRSFQRMGVFSSNTKGSSIFVMNLVNGLVKRRPVHESVYTVMEGIFKDKEDGNLGPNVLPASINRLN